MSDLAPCPFCGRSIPEMYGVQVICEGCGAGTMVHDTAEEAIAAWNHRAPPPSPAPGVVTTTPANPAHGVSASDEAVRLAGDILMSHGINAPEQVIYRAAREILETAAIGAGGHAVEDNGFTDRALPVKAMSGDVEDNRVLRLHFRRPVTDDDRKAMCDALNLHQASLTHPAPSGQAVVEENAVYWKDAYDRIAARNATQANALVLAVNTLDDLASGAGLSRPIEQIIRELNDCASSGGGALSNPPAQPGWRPTHRHKKRGGEYMLLGYGKMQAENWYLPGAMEAGPSVDMQEIAVYCGEDGKLWVRPREDFEDGRFEALPASPLSGDA